MTRLRFSLEDERDFHAAEALASIADNRQSIGNHFPAGLAPAQNALLLSAGLLHATDPLVRQLQDMRPVLLSGAIWWWEPRPKYRLWLAAHVIASGQRTGVDVRTLLVSHIERELPDSWAMEALLAIGEIRPIRGLFERASVELRVKILRTIGEVGTPTPEILEILLYALDVQFDQRVRYLAVKSIGQLGGSKASVVDALLLLLDDSDEHIRLAAIDSLGRVAESQPRIIDALKAASRNCDGWERTRIATALGHIASHSPQLVSDLLADLRSESHYIREVSIKALAQSRQSSREISDALLRATIDPILRLDAIKALGYVISGDPDVSRRLTEITNDPSENYNHRMYAMRSLAAIGVANSHTIASLSEIVRSNSVIDEELIPAKEAARTLGILGDSGGAVVEVLVQALVDDLETGVWCEAALAIGRLGYADTSVVSILETAFDAPIDENDFSKQWAAAESLGMLGRLNRSVLDLLHGKIAIFKEPIDYYTDIDRDIHLDALEHALAIASNIAHRDDTRSWKLEGGSEWLRFEIICSFCGVNQKKARHMISGSDGTLICDDCVKMLCDFLEEAKPTGGESHAVQTGPLKVVVPMWSSDCSFCGRPPSEVEILFAIPDSVSICCACVIECDKIINNVIG